MMRRWSVIALLVFAPAVSTAQPADDHRWYIAVNGGVQPTVSDFSDAATFEGPSAIYLEIVSSAATGEPSSFNGAYGVESGLVYDVSGGVLLWRNVGVGATMSFFRRDANTDIAARLPHPFFRGSARTVAGQLPLDHRERAFHLNALVRVVPVRPSSLTLTVFGGPTVFMLSQYLVTDVRFTHSYPYDSAAFAGPVTQSHSRSKVGFNVGADVAYYFTKTLGVGWLTRYSRATVDLPSVGDRAVAVPVGGLHAVGGVRLRF